MATRDSAAEILPEDAPSRDGATAPGVDGAANDARVDDVSVVASPAAPAALGTRTAGDGTGHGVADGVSGVAGPDAARSGAAASGAAASAVEASDGGTDGVPGTDESAADPTGDGVADVTAPADLAPERPNAVSRAVDEIARLLGEIEDAREELVARGVQAQTLNVLVELDFHGREDGRDTLLESALAAAREAYGVGAIGREELERRLADLLVLERDIAHARRIARQQGLDLQVLNFLTQIIRKNPGDGGERAVNTFLGYALACGIPLERVADIAQRFGGRQESVLPDIERQVTEKEGRWPVGELVRDAALGLCLGLGILWLLV